MPIEFPCPQCGRTLRTPDGSAGKRAKCPSCESIADIPEQSTSPSAADDPFGDLSGSGAAGGNPFEASERDRANPFADSSSRPGAGGFDDPANPYASPHTADDFVATSGGQIQRRKVDFGEAASATWEIFSRNFGEMLIAGLIFCALWFGWSMASSLVINLLQAGLGVAVGNNPFAQALGGRANPIFNDAAALMLYIVIQLVGALVNMAVYAWLQTGLLRFSLAAARGRPLEYGLLFSSGNYVLKMVGFSLLYILIMYGFMLLGAVPGIIMQEPVPILVGVGLSILVVLVVLLMFTFAPLFIIDRNEGVFQAMGNSWHYMSNNFLTVFALLLVLGLLASLAALITCCIGYIGAFPFLFLLQAVMYLMATSQKISR